ncbi:MAG TPA: acyl-CoA dehydrogenase family protein [Polyangiaceae bacterium]|nr:acyl-CoA dehydrogenase family protein [Polyangiaceae bacterium]
MDFGLNEQQTAVQDLAKQIFRGLAPAESLAALERAGEGFHSVVWDALGKAQLLGLSLPEEVGGGGMGLVELCLLVEQSGDAACPVPLLPTLVMSGLPIAHFGTSDQHARFLAPVVSGSMLLTAALVASSEPIVATRNGSEWVLNGTRECVPALHLAARVLVPAHNANGSIGMFLVDTRSNGARSERQTGTNGEQLGRLLLSGVRVASSDVLGDASAGQDILEWTLERTWLAQCALELGLARRALLLTANYARERQQFGRPIGTFQAVAQRAADAYVDVETIRLTLFRAAWLLDQGRDARREVAVAKAVAAEAGHRVVCAAQHIHGGVGFDRDYPLYRYFLASKQNEFTLGSASHHLARLGKMLAQG